MFSDSVLISSPKFVDSVFRKRDAVSVCCNFVIHWPILTRIGNSTQELIKSEFMYMLPTLFNFCNCITLWNIKCSLPAFTYASSTTFSSKRDQKSICHCFAHHCVSACYVHPVAWHPTSWNWWVSDLGYLAATDQWNPIYYVSAGSLSHAHSIAAYKVIRVVPNLRMSLQ